MEATEKNVVKNVIQIRNNKGLTKREVAEKIGINEASYGRIENGQIALSYNHLASIASCFDMEVIDVITYPKRYVLSETNEKSEPVEAILQIKLQRDKRDQVLNLVFGENNLEILNK